MYELWRNDNFDFTAFHGLWSRVNQLTWSALLLRVGSGLGEQEMLGHGLTSDMTRPRRIHLSSVHLSTLPKLRLGDLTAHDQFAMECRELRRLDQNFFADAEIVNGVVNGRATGTRDGLGTRGRWARRRGRRRTTTVVCGAIGRRCRSSGDAARLLRRWQHASLTRGAVVADDSRKLCLECLAFRKSLRRSKSEIMAIAVVLEAYFETHLGGAFF
jgi:hypothetical protein